jgi:hypothetical protein
MRAMGFFKFHFLGEGTIPNVLLKNESGAKDKDQSPSRLRQERPGEQGRGLEVSSVLKRKKPPQAAFLSDF